MQNFLEKILLLADGLQERPFNERRALFFTSFLVLGTLVFAFWSNHMSRQFGVAFGGSGFYEREAKTARGQESEENILSPLAAIRENAGVVSNEAVNLFSALSDQIQELSGLALSPTAEPGREAISKEPPVVVEEQGKKEPASAVVKKEGSAPAPVKTGEKVIVKSAPPPEVLAKSAPAEPPRPKADSTVPPPAKVGVKSSRIFSILATNLVSIRQAFADFYDYLTQ